MRRTWQHLNPPFLYLFGCFSASLCFILFYFVMMRPLNATLSHFQTFEALVGRYRMQNIGNSRFCVRLSNGTNCMAVSAFYCLHHLISLYIWMLKPILVLRLLAIVLLLNQPLELLKVVAQQADTKYRQVAKEPGQSSPPRTVYSKVGKYYNLFGSKYKNFNL